MAETKKVAEEKPKNIITKIKESIDDKEEQLAYLSTLIRVIVLFWSAGILTLAYVKLPAAFNIPEQKLDPTFIASVFTGTLATFGVQAAGKKKSASSDSTGGSKPSYPTQILRIEQAPIKIVTQSTGK